MTHDKEEIIIEYHGREISLDPRNPILPAEFGNRRDRRKKEAELRRWALKEFSR